MAVATLETSNELVQAIFRGNRHEFFLLDPESATYQDAQKRTVLHAAAHCGEAGIAELLLKEGARVNAKDARWFTPLHRACASNSAEVVRILLAHGADRNARDKSWQTPLHVAAANASLDCIELLFSPTDSLTNVNASDRNGHSPLHHAVYGGHIEVARFLLEKGASVNAFDKRDRRAMHWAAVCGHAQLVELLHQFGAEVNCRDKDQYTPLHAVSALGHVATANTLIALGAELEATTAHGNTPLHIACLNGRDAVVELLLQAIHKAKSDAVLGCTSPVTPNASTASPDEDRQTIAEQVGFDAVVTVVNQFSEPDHMTPLHLAVSSTGGAFCVRHLLEVTTPTSPNAETASKPVSLANLQAAGGEDESHPLHMAAFHGRFDRAQLLLDNGASADARDRLGNTALHIAADRGHELFVLTMLRAGCPWNARGQGGSTALHRAALSGYTPCLSRLIAAAILDRRTDEDSGPTHLNGDFNLDLDNVTEWGNSPEALERLVDLMQLTDDDGRTVVHAAALGANLDCLKLTLLAGGNPFSTDRDGRTPLHYAVASCAFAARNTMDMSGSSSMNMCANHSTDSSALTDSRSFTIYRTNAISDATNAALVFLKLGAQVNIADRFGCTPLHLACAYDTSGALVKHLLAYGADPFSCTHWPPLATVPGYRDSHSIGSVSHDYGSDVAREPTEASLRRSYYSPLHLAVSTGNDAAVKLLLHSIPVQRVRDYSLGHMSIDSDAQEVSDDVHKSPSTTCAPSPLLIAALRGNDAIMRMLLQACTDSGASNEGKGTQIPKGHEDNEVTGKLLTPERITNASGQTILMLAASAGHTEICRLLLFESRWGTRSLVEAKDAIYRWTALHHAAAQGHSDIISLLLDFSESRTQSQDESSMRSLRCEPDEHGRTALMLAAQNNHGEVVRVLLSPLSPTKSPRLSPRKPLLPLLSGNEDRYSVNAFDVYGRTALHRAIANGHVECAKLLLSHGADAAARDFRRRHALHMAASGGKLSTLSLLITHITEQLKHRTQALDGSQAMNELQPLDEYGFSPLHFAAYRGHTECVRLLLSVPCYRKLRGNVHTPLHCTIQDGHLDCLQLLLERFGPQHLTTKDADGRTILHISALCNQVACLDQILVQAESYRPCTLETADVTSESNTNSNTVTLSRFAMFVSEVDNTGRTALMLAASSGATGAVERLLAVHNRLLSALSDSADSTDAEGDSDPISTTLERLNLGARDSDGRSALHHACIAADDGPGHLILQAIQDDSVISCPDHLKRTPLHLAISSGLPSLVEVLIARGADLYAVDADGMIPVMSCVSSTPVATCLSLGLAAMFPPLDGAPENPFLRVNRLHSANNPSCGSNSSRTSHSHDLDAINLSGLQLMSASLVQPTQAMLATVEPLDNAGRTAMRPLSYPGSESDFF